MSLRRNGPPTIRIHRFGHFVGLDVRDDGDLSKLPMAPFRDSEFPADAQRRLRPALSSAVHCRPRAPDRPVSPVREADVDLLGVAGSHGYRPTDRVIAEIVDLWPFALANMAPTE
jgi:hypothetical protein